MTYFIGQNKRIPVHESVLPSVSLSVHAHMRRACVTGSRERTGVHENIPYGEYKKTITHVDVFY